MKRALILAAAMALITPAAVAQSNEMSRGEPFAVRSCAKGFDGPSSDVCYNQVTSSLVWLGPLPTPITRNKERVVQVNCDRRRDYKAGSTRASIAAEYCPKVGSLPNILSIAAN
jgi:hypothetical protein